MSSCVCKISFKSVQVCGGCCKMFRGLTFLGHSVESNAKLHENCIFVVFYQWAFHITSAVQVSDGKTVLCTIVHRAVKVISQITSMSILTNFPCQNQILWAFARFLLSGVSICPVTISPVSICPWIDDVRLSCWFCDDAALIAISTVNLSAVDQVDCLTPSILLKL